MIPLNQEGSLVQIAKTAPERSEAERTLILVAQSENAAAKFEAKNLNTPMPNPPTSIVSQDVSATHVIAQTLLLITSTPKYDIIATLAVSKPNNPQLVTASTLKTFLLETLHLLKFFQMLLKSRWINSWQINILSWQIKLSFKLISKGWIKE